MKKIIAKIVTFMLVFTLSLTALVGCGDEREKYSDTYTGEVSTQEYNTMDDAVDAFIVDEYTGDTSSEVKNTQYNAIVLTVEEVEKLGLSEEQLTGVENVYSCELTFSEGDNVRSVKLYLLSMDNGSVKYYSELPEKGKMITKSYYDSVMNNSAMVESEISGTMNMKTKYNMDGMKGSATTKMTMKLVNTETACYAKVKTTTAGESMTVEEYIVATDGGIRLFVSEGSVFEDWSDDIEDMLGVDPSTVSNLYELNTTSGMEYDHTYFEKTDYGFCLTGEKMQEAMNLVLADMDLDALGAGVTFDVSGLTLKCYVKDGKLSKLVLNGDFKMDMDMSSYGYDGVICKYTFSYDYTLNYTYGPQTVKLPQQVQNLLNA